MANILIGFAPYFILLFAHLSVRLFVAIVSEYSGGR